MPQISQILETYASQAFWLLIVFGLIYFVIGLGMLPKIEATVDARAAKIANDLAEAERAKAAARELEAGLTASLVETRAAAQAEANAAKAKAAKDAENRLAKADADVMAKVAEAEAGIAVARAKAMTNVEALAREAAADIVAKVSGATITAAQTAAAVKAVMANG